MKILLCLALSVAIANADPSPAPRFIGQLDVDDLQKSAHRNVLLGNALAGVGAGIGALSTALFITGLVRHCPANDPGCNDAISTSGTYVGAGALLFVTVGITLFTVGMTQRKIVKKLRQ
jgi:hypothetical protein